MEQQRKIQAHQQLFTLIVYLNWTGALNFAYSDK